MTRIIIVNEQDEQIDLKGYDALRYEDIYRVSALWLTDSNTGEVLLAQRKWTKENDPGKWAGSVAGTVDEGESYLKNIVKEIEEEIGLSNLSLTKGPKQYTDDGKHKYFVQWFLASVDKTKVKIVIQEDEVEAVKWIVPEELIADLYQQPENYTPNLTDSLRLLGYQVKGAT